MPPRLPLDQTTRDLRLHARTITAATVRRHRAAVRQSPQRGQRSLHYVVIGVTGRAGYEADATRVVLEARIVQ
jgi:hypothetical protein